MFILTCVTSVSGRFYLNKFAVHIPDGERVARDVAASHGYINLGQVLYFIFLSVLSFMFVFSFSS